MCDRLGHIRCVFKDYDLGKNSQFAIFRFLHLKLCISNPVHSFVHHNTSSYIYTKGPLDKIQTRWFWGSLGQLRYTHNTFNIFASCAKVLRQFVAITISWKHLTLAGNFCTRKCRKIFTKVVPHCLISTLTLKVFLVYMRTCYMLVAAVKNNGFYNNYITYHELKVRYTMVLNRS